MGLPDGLGGVQSGLVTWGIPAVGGLVGVVLGDAMGAGKFLADLIPLKIGVTGMGVLVAAVYAVVGTLVFSKFGTIGKFVGALFWGMSLGTLYQALTGKTINIPGFSGV